MKKNRLLLFALLFSIFSACKHTDHFLIYVNKRMANTAVLVKVKSSADLPEDSILVSSDNIYSINSRSFEKNQQQKIHIIADSARFTYRFILPVTYTALLHPSREGAPAIEYVVINNDRDTIFLPGSRHKNNNGMQFTKKHNGLFVLYIMPENLGEGEYN